MIHRGKMILAIIGLGLLTASAASAAFPSLVPEVCTGKAEISQCNLGAVELMFTTIAQMILGVTGSIALGVFVYGGILFMTAGGDSGKIKAAVKALRTATIGLALIILSGTAIKILLKVLSGA